MPWMIKSRGRKLHARDGVGGPVYIIDDRREYPFENLPPGVDPLHDSDLLCCAVESIEGKEPAPILDAPTAPEQAPVPSEPAEEKPKKRKPRVR